MSRSADRWIRWTNDRVCGAAGTDRGDGVLPAHASPDGVARAAGVGGGADAVVGGRMIVAASTTLLVDSRSGRRGGVLPWALLAAGSVASLAANVAVAEPTAAGRVIAAWPSFALIAVYKLPMRQVGRAADVGQPAHRAERGVRRAVDAARRAAGRLLISAAVLSQSRLPEPPTGTYGGGHGRGAG